MYQCVALFQLVFSITLAKASPILTCDSVKDGPLLVIQNDSVRNYEKCFLAKPVGAGIPWTVNFSLPAKATYWVKNSGSMLYYQLNKDNALLYNMTDSTRTNFKFTNNNNLESLVSFNNSLMLFLADDPRWYEFVAGHMNLKDASDRMSWLPLKHSRIIVMNGLVCSIGGSAIAVRSTVCYNSTANESKQPYGSQLRFTFDANYGQVAVHGDVVRLRWQHDQQKLYGKLIYGPYSYPFDNKWIRIRAIVSTNDEIYLYGQAERTPRNLSRCRLNNCSKTIEVICMSCYLPGVINSCGETYAPHYDESASTSTSTEGVQHTPVTEPSSSATITIYNLSSTSSQQTIIDQTSTTIVNKGYSCKISNITSASLVAVNMDTFETVTEETVNVQTRVQLNCSAEYTIIGKPQLQMCKLKSGSNRTYWDGKHTLCRKGYTVKASTDDDDNVDNTRSTEALDDSRKPTSSPPTETGEPIKSAFRKFLDNKDARRAMMIICAVQSVIISILLHVSGHLLF